MQENLCKFLLACSDPMQHVLLHRPTFVRSTFAKLQQLIMDGPGHVNQLLIWFSWL